jgi:hypothetical protein
MAAKQPIRRDLISEARASAPLNETLVMIKLSDYPAEQGSDGHLRVDLLLTRLSLTQPANRQTGPKQSITVALACDLVMS